VSRLLWEQSETEHETDLITSNAGFTATFVHMLLWNYEEIKAGWAWAKPSNLRKLLMLKTYKFWQNQETPEARLARKEADPNLDPHYKLMLRNLYPETPIVGLLHLSRRDLN
jgi:hypothetical protein